MFQMPMSSPMMTTMLGLLLRGGRRPGQPQRREREQREPTTNQNLPLYPMVCLPAYPSVHCIVRLAIKNPSWIHAT